MTRELAVLRHHYRQRQQLTRSALSLRGWVWLPILLSCLCGCSDTGDEQASQPGTAVSTSPPERRVADPAMEPLPAPEMATATRIDILPTRITLDKENDKVFIPELGWLPLQEFWDIYETNPARLPADMDYKAVHQLKISLAETDDDDA
jgi:hypothetical protein